MNQTAFSPRSSDQQTLLSVRALIKDPTGRVLFLRRSPANNRFAGTWEFPGGKVDPNEDLGAALVREVREECGLVVTPSALLSAADFRLEGRRLICLLFAADCAEDADVSTTLSDEHDCAVWESLEAVDSRLILNGVTSTLLKNLRAKPAAFSPKLPMALSAKALVHDSRGHYLTIQRSAESKFNADKWDLPGGKVDAGESLDQALAREVAEEAGLAIEVGPIVGCNASEVPGKRVVIYVFFVARAASVETKLSEEHGESEWAAPEVFVRREFCGQFMGFVQGYFNVPEEVPNSEAVPTLIETTGADGRKSKHINPVWHKARVIAYSDEFPDYQFYAQTLIRLFGDAAKRYAPLSIVQARPKTVSSYAEKLVRKAPKFAADASYDFTDLCGARVICQTEADLERMRRYVWANFEVDADNSEDTFVRLKSSEFGYRSIHFVVQVSAKTRGLPAEERARIGDRKAEIQIRTILQHAWADILHDRMYKGAIQATQGHERESATIAAMLEKTDLSLSGLADELDAYTGDYMSHLDPEKLREELATARLVLENEPEPKAQPGHAFKLARLLSQNGDYAEAVKVLRAFPAPFTHPQAPAIALCLGELLGEVASAGDEPKMPDFAECRRELKKLLPGGDFFRDYEEAGVEDERFLHLAGRAAHLLAHTHERSLAPGSEAKAKRFHLQAIQLTPDNPYHMLDMVSFMLAQAPNEETTSLIDDQLQRAAHTCERHIEVGTELFRAYLAMGRIRLLQARLRTGSGLREASFTAYLNALALLLATPIAPFRAQVLREIAALRRMHRLKDEAEIPLSFRNRIRLLEIGLALVRPDFVTELLKRDDRFLFSGDRPALIVAGSCGSLSADRVTALETLLAEPLAGFSGSVVFGGTHSGASGICARLLRANPDAQRIGYLPSKVPFGQTVAEDIFVVKSEGDDFSIAQALAYWSDLLSSGIAPHQVRVLGLEGGEISRMEYTLAATLGARVGLLLESPEADPGVSALRSEARERIGVLPSERATIRSFINVPQAHNLSSDQVVELASIVHARFLHQNRYKNPDEAMQPWDKLRADFRESNYSQVRSIERALAQFGLELAPLDDPNPEVVLKDEPELVETLSQEEHGRWNAERITSGWRYSRRRDPDRKLSPYLVPWADLPDKIRQYDRENVLQWPELLAGVGRKIVRRR